MISRYVLPVLLAGVALNHVESRELVSWSEIGDSIQSQICIVSAPSTRAGYHVSIPCKDSLASSPLEQAVSYALKESMDLLPPSLLPVELEPVYLIEDERDWPGAATEVLLADQYFLRVVVPRLLARMLDKGLVCSDCPSIERDQLRRVTWEEFCQHMGDSFIPYFGAGGEPRFKNCSSCVDTRRIAGRDPYILHAALMGARNSESFVEVVFSHMAEVAANPELVPGGDMSVDNLRQYLMIKIKESAEIKAEICQALAPSARDLGLELQFCQPPA